MAHDTEEDGMGMEKDGGGRGEMTQEEHMMSEYERGLIMWKVALVALIIIMGVLVLAIVATIPRSPLKERVSGTVEDIEEVQTSDGPYTSVTIDGIHRKVDDDARPDDLREGMEVDAWVAFGGRSITAWEERW